MKKNETRIKHQKLCTKRKKEQRNTKKERNAYVELEPNVLSPL